MIAAAEENQQGRNCKGNNKERNISFFKKWKNFFFPAGKKNTCREGEDTVVKIAFCIKKAADNTGCYYKGQKNKGLELF